MLGASKLYWQNACPSGPGDQHRHCLLIREHERIPLKPERL
jgi:hypothetical protein